MHITPIIKHIIDYIKGIYRYYTFWVRPKITIKKNDSKKILIIRIDAIGDCILWLDQAKEFRHHYPEYKLVLLHNQAWTDIAHQLTWFDEFIPFDRKKINNKKYYSNLISLLNKHKFKMVYSPVFSRDFFTVDWIVHNINAQEKIGYEGDYQNNHYVVDQNLYLIKNHEKLNLKKRADKWYTFLVPNDNNCIMELQRNAHFVRKTMDAKYRCGLPSIPFKTQSNLLNNHNQYALLFMGASTTNKMWPTNNFVQIANHLQQPTIVLCGSENEKPLSLNFISLYKGEKTIVDLTGKTSLIDLINIIANASIVISNDTSASHISAATRTISICLLGGGHWGRFHPYKVESLSDEDKQYLPIVITTKNKDCFNCNWRCKYPLENGCWRCISNISVEDVKTTIMSLNNKIDQ